MMSVFWFLTNYSICCVKPLSKAGFEPRINLRDKTLSTPCSVSSKIHCKKRASGAMDNASAYGAEDSRFDSWLARKQTCLKTGSNPVRLKIPVSQSAESWAVS